MTEEHAHRVKFRQEVCYDETYEGREADFFNRVEEKRRALSDLMAPNTSWTVWVVGERRAGKSSLLCLLGEKCRRANMVVLNIPWQAIYSLDDFYHEYIEALDQALNISFEERQQFLCDPSNSSAFRQALEQRRLAIGEKKVVVILDELDSILREVGPQNQREIIGTLERLVSIGQKLIVASTRRPEDIETSTASPLIRKATLIELHPFSDEDMNNLISAYLQPSTVEIQEQIRYWSGNWPFYAKAILFHYFLLPNNISNHFQRALSEAVNTIAPLCEHLYRHHWNEDERRAVLLLARKKNISSADLYLLGTAAVTAFKNLVKRGYFVQDEQGQYRFRVHLIGKWLHQWLHRQLEEEKLNLEAWLRVLAWREEPGERVIRVTREELRRSNL